VKEDTGVDENLKRKEFDDKSKSKTGKRKKQKQNQKVYVAVNKLKPFWTVWVLNF
jgi:hypothetical protein